MTSSTGSQEPRREADGCNHEWYLTRNHGFDWMMCACKHCDMALIIKVDRKPVFGWQRKLPLPTIQDNI